MATNQLTQWNPNRDIQTFRNLFDRAFAWPSPMAWQSPNGGELETLRLDMYEKGNDIIVEAAIPGVDPKDVDITVEGDVLTIKAETKRSSETKETDYFMSEQYYGSLHRSVRLPSDVEIDKAVSSFKNGMLKITLPKSKATKSRKIKLSAE